MSITNLEGYLYRTLQEAKRLLDRRPRTEAARKARDAELRQLVAEAIDHAPAVDAARRWGSPYPPSPRERARTDG